MEKQRERLVELLNEANETVIGFTVDGDLERLAEYLLENCVVVLPENAMLDVRSRMVIEEETMRIVEKETYTISWEKEKYCKAE